MKITMLATTIAVLYCCDAVAQSPNPVGAVHANLVKVTERKPQTRKGQDFSFHFAGLPSSNHTGGTFVVHAAGDYAHFGFISTEHLTWNIEGVVSGGPVGHFIGCDSRFHTECTTPTITSSVGGPFDFVEYSGGIGWVEFQRSYRLSASELDAIIANGSADIFVDLGEAVDDGQFVEVSLSFHQVPEPSSVLLAAMAAVGLLARACKRQWLASR